MKGRTTISVTHRLSTIRNTDMIYVVDNGKVSEEGTHEELIMNNQLYSRLCKDLARC